MFDGLHPVVPNWLRNTLSVSSSVSLGIVMTDLLKDKLLGGLIGGLVMTFFLVIGKMLTPSAEKWGEKVSDHIDRLSAPAIGRQDAPRVVFIDDEVSIGIMSKLTDDYRIEHYEGLRPGVKAIVDPSKSAPVTVILDLRLPGSTPEGAVTAVRAVYDGRLVLFTGMDAQSVQWLADKASAEVWQKPMYGADILVALGKPPPARETQPV